MIESFSYNLFTIRSLFGDIRFSENEKVKFISTSSSETKPGTLFIPLKANRDGHEFIPDAISRGAVAFLCEKEHPILKTLNFNEIQKAIFVEDTFLALGKLASFHRDRYSPFVIGITGSSGKTTTKELMGLVARQIGSNHVVVTEKNYNNEIGVPFTLFRINIDTKLVVCEMGMNHKREISRLTAMAKPDIALITNIGPCHIENLGSLENIARAKKRKLTLKTFSISKNPDIQLEKIIPEGFLLQVFQEKLNWKIPGEKILENLAGVVAVGKEIGFSPSQILKGLSSFKAKDKRFVIEKGFYNLINDTYNANPDSMISSLLALKQVSSDKPYYAILGDMKELGKFSKNYHTELGEFCKKLGLKGLISFGKDSVFITKHFSDSKKSFGNKHFIDSNESIADLISYVKEVIPKGSFILVKGSRSMKMERIIEGLSH